MLFLVSHIILQLYANKILSFAAYMYKLKVTPHDMKCYICTINMEVLLAKLLWLQPHKVAVSLEYFHSALANHIWL